MARCGPPPKRRCSRDGVCPCSAFSSPDGAISWEWPITRTRGFWTGIATRSPCPPRRRRGRIAPGDAHPHATVLRATALADPDAIRRRVMPSGAQAGGVDAKPDAMVPASLVRTLGKHGRQRTQMPRCPSPITSFGARGRLSTLCSCRDHRTSVMPDSDRMKKPEPPANHRHAFRRLDNPAWRICYK